MSFQLAVEYAKEKATLLKGEWRRVTSEPWGAIKATTWFATIDESTPGDLPTLRQTVANLEGQLARIDGDIGVARREQAMVVQRAAQEHQAKEQAARARQEAERRQRRIAELRETVAGEEEAIQVCRAAMKAWEDAERALQDLPIPLPHRPYYTWTCKGCGLVATLGVDPDGVIDLFEVQPAAPIPETTKARRDEEHALAAAAVVAAERALDEAQGELQGIQTARHVLDELLAMQAQPTDTPEALDPGLMAVAALVARAPGDPENLLELEANRQKLATGLQEARTAIRRVEDHQERVDQAKQRTADAAWLHTEIETWLRLAEDLGPEGIPAQLLHLAIDPINDRLAYSGNSLGFMGLSLTPDMELVGRPEENDPETPRRYELVSGSAQWRMEAALADAIGTQMETVYAGRRGGFDLPFPLVLDRFDVLDGPGRGKAIRWLLSLGRQVILLGTLRNRDVPQELPQGLSVHWLQAGESMGE